MQICDNTITANADRIKKLGIFQKYHIRISLLHVASYLLSFLASSLHFAAVLTLYPFNC